MPSNARGSILRRLTVGPKISGSKDKTTIKSIEVAKAIDRSKKLSVAPSGHPENRMSTDSDDIRIEGRKKKLSFTGEAGDVKVISVHYPSPAPSIDKKTSLRNGETSYDKRKSLIKSTEPKHDFHEKIVGVEKFILVQKHESGVMKAEEHKAKEQSPVVQFDKEIDSEDSYDLVDEEVDEEIEIEEEEEEEGDEWMIGEDEELVWGGEEEWEGEIKEEFGKQKSDEVKLEKGKVEGVFEEGEKEMDISLLKEKFSEVERERMVEADSSLKSIEVHSTLEPVVSLTSHEIPLRLSIEVPRNLDEIDTEIEATLKAESTSDKSEKSIVDEIVKHKKKHYKTIKVIKKVKRKKIVDESKKERQQKLDEIQSEIKKTDSGLLFGERYVTNSTELGVEAVILTEDEVPKMQSQIDLEKQEQNEQIELIKTKINELTAAKRKNRILQKSIIDYFKQKKVNNVYSVGEQASGQTLERYNKRLKLLDEFMQAAEAEKKRKQAELDSMAEKLHHLEEVYQKELEALLQWETDLGKRLIESCTSKEIDESVINHLVKRHENVLKQISEARLRFIKLQNRLQSKEKNLKNLVVLGGNLNLIEYEQLLMDNHIIAEKIEERDEDLSRLRAKMMAIIHTYAHVIEKSDTVVEDIEVSKAKTAAIDKQINIARSRVIKLQQYRDKMRTETRNMKRNAGLIIRPRLANDYEDSLLKGKEINAELQKTIKHFHEQRSKIHELRKNIKATLTFKEF